ncbi:MAG: adenylyltransferase/cytidyltransferase family protein [Aquincola sp.]|nr:adenylyltransferase/cytidyltransferase family protein [Aquincola sp.]|tara:strand:+ start:4407 stop:4856 length:450 start_codon:yes stop_codon:yes gene_type:complete
MLQVHPYHTAVVIGRLQIFHRGHGTLLRQALEQAEQVVIVLGSSFAARSSKNPFTWQERANMVRATLTAQEQARVAFVPVRDYADDPRWAAAVHRGVAPYSAQPQRTVLMGFRKDTTSDYLNHFPQWQLHLVQQVLPLRRHAAARGEGA